MNEATDEPKAFSDAELDAMADMGDFGVFLNAILPESGQADT